MFEFILLVLYILCDCVYFCIVDMIFPLLYYNQNPKQEFSYPFACLYNNLLYFILLLPN